MTIDRAALLLAIAAAIATAAFALTRRTCACGLTFGSWWALQRHRKLAHVD